MADAASVQAKLLYFSPPPDGSSPFTNINVDPTTGKRHNWIPQEHVVEIENVRGHESGLTLDNAGFQFVKHGSKHRGFDDVEKIKAEYYPESVELLKKLTGASRVVLFDHTVRRNRPGEIEDSPEKRQPVAQVHVDQTPASATARVHRHVPDLAPSLLEKRFQIINLWRPISHPAFDWPLALCDYRTVDKERDLIPVKLIYPDREPGETFGVRYDKSHRWKYLRGMQTDEAVLIKCYDSLQNGKVAVFTPHTGFQDPSTPEGTPYRESIELRALVFYD